MEKSLAGKWAGFSSPFAVLRVCVCFAVLFLVVGGFSLEAQTSKDDVVASLQKFDKQFDGFYPWLMKVYDLKSGGFYCCLSARTPQKGRTFGPDMQSTNFGVGFISEAGLSDQIPESFRAKWISFFQSRQDPVSGYFYDDAYPELKEDERNLGRAVMFALSTLKTLGSTPLYPVPGEKRSEKPSGASPKKDEGTNVKSSVPVERGTEKLPASAPAFLATDEAFEKWLDARPWDFAWTALDQISSQANIISKLPPTIRKQRIDHLLSYISKKQDAETGFVGGGVPIVRISGAFKMISFCHRLGVDVPRPDQIRSSVLQWYRGYSDVDNMFFIRNPAELLCELKKQTGKDLSPEDLAVVIDFSTKKLDTLRCPDGGFSSYLNKFHIRPNDLLGDLYPVERQGDLNAAASARALRRSLYFLANIKNSPPLKAPASFWQECGKY